MERCRGRQKFRKEGGSTTKMNDYEKERLERIRSNRARMAALDLPSLVASVAPEPAPSSSKKKPPTSRGLSSKRKREELPRRRSARLQGEAADGSEIAEETRGTVIVTNASGVGRRIEKESTPVPQERHPEGEITFRSINAPDVDKVFLQLLQKEATAISNSANSATEIKNLRTKTRVKNQASVDSSLRDLQLSENDVAKVVKNSVTHLAFHPTTNMVLLASADKRGGLGLWVVDDEILSEALNSNILSKSNGDKLIEEELNGDSATLQHVELEPPSDSDGTENKFDGVFSIVNTHYQYISGLKWAGNSSVNLYSCSYDGSIRCLDASKGVFSLAWSDEEMEYSCMDLAYDASTIVLGTNLGDLDVIDLRAKTKTQESIDIHDRKVNTVHFDPLSSVHFVTASTDATVKLWDMRKLGSRSKPVATASHKQTCQAAYLAPDGSQKVLSTSFDNTVRVWDGKKGMEPLISVRHDNQTGRWVLPFRAIWAPDSKHFIIGNMKRYVDVVDSQTGQLEYQLSNEELMTAIPARNCVHPTLHILASGTASGRLHVFR